MQLFAGLFFLIVLAALAAWHMPDALGEIQAMIYARREALRVQKLAYAFYRQRVRDGAW